MPGLLQRDLLRSVLACYEQADKHVKRYPPTEAMTLRGHVRRADIEVDLRNVAAKYFGAEATAQPNRTGSTYHSVVVIGAVKLTQSKLPNTRRMVKPSAFREEYAANGDQYLLKFMENPRRKKVVTIGGARDYLFAVLIHGCSRKNKARPYFVRFAFPNKECTRWLHQIDLMKRFTDVVTQFYAPITAAENEQLRVRLKKNIKRGGKEKQA